jgi:hypothetical protein
MDRGELLALDKETLVELIVRLRERAAELEAERGRPPKTPGNSSVPPSTGSRPSSSAPSCCHRLFSRASSRVHRAAG